MTDTCLEEIIALIYLSLSNSGKSGYPSICLGCRGEKNWLKVSEYLKPGKLVVMGSLEDISKRGRYKLGRIEEVIPQIRNGKPIVRRAKVAVTKVNEITKEVKIEYVLWDVSRLALVENA